MSSSSVAAIAIGVVALSMLLLAYCFRRIRMCRPPPPPPLPRNNRGTTFPCFSNYPKFYTWTGDLVDSVRVSKENGFLVLELLWMNREVEWRLNFLSLTGEDLFIVTTTNSMHQQVLL